MSTRSCIARPLGDIGFEGRYCHSNGYPTWNGKMLWRLYHDHFAENVERMITGLIDDHPSGWSSLNPDSRTDYETWERIDMTSDSTFIGTCYCHDPHFSTRGDIDPTEQNWYRHIEGQETADPLFIEYVYVLHKMGMDIHTNVQTGCETDSGYEHKYVTTVFWSEPEPDWKQIEKQCSIVAGYDDAEVA